MLNGIGGRTVREAKENLTVTEVRRWVAYIEKYGSLNTARRVVEGTGVTSYLVSRANGGKAKLETFIPHYGNGEIGSLEDIMKMATGDQSNV